MFPNGETQQRDYSVRLFLWNSYTIGFRFFLFMLYIFMPVMTALNLAHDTDLRQSFQYLAILGFWGSLIKEPPGNPSNYVIK